MNKSATNTARSRATMEGPDGTTPRVSGFVSTGDEAKAVAEAIRAANEELERQTVSYMSVPLAVAIEQRDHALRTMHEARATLEQRRIADLASLQIQLREKDRALTHLRQQVMEAERELEHLRDEPKTVIGLGGIDNVSGRGSTTPLVEGDLQAAMETAWQEVQDARRLCAELQEAHDAALRDRDEVRVEVYAELEAAQDEVIALQTQLDDVRRTFDEARDEWENQCFQLRSELDEVRQSLHTQLQSDPAAQPAWNVEVGAETPASEPPISRAVRSRSPTGSPLTRAPVAAATIARASTRDPEATQPVPLINPLASNAAVFSTTHSRSTGHGASFSGAANQTVHEEAELDVDVDEVARPSRGFGLHRLFQRG